MIEPVQAGPVEDDRRTRPVFLIGCHRSGTTLARRLLDAHPAIACPPESKFLAGIRAFFVHPQAVTGLLSLEVPVERMLEEARHMTQRVFDDYARRRGKRRWIDKTPNYFRILPFIDRLFRREALFLFIVRHPLDTVASLLEQRTFLASDPDVAAALREPVEPAVALAHYWCTVNQTLQDFANRHPSRTCWFRYEDLVREPERAMARLLRFIGEEWTPDLATKAFGDGSSATGYADWKTWCTVAVHRDSVDAWPRRMPTGAALWNVVGPLASSWGYTSAPTLESAAPIAAQPSVRRE